MEKIFISDVYNVSHLKYNQQIFLQKCIKHIQNLLIHIKNWIKS